MLHRLPCNRRIVLRFESSRSESLISLVSFCFIADSEPVRAGRLQNDLFLDRLGYEDRQFALQNDSAQHI